MKREFIEEGMGFNVLRKEGLDLGSDAIGASMNLKDKVRPTFGVEVRNGDEVFKGADY